MRRAEDKIVSLSDLVDRWPSAPVVLVTGCFDLLHPGHLTFLHQARKYGSQEQEYGSLVVSVGNDELVRKLKGHDRPYWPARYRAWMLASLMVTDLVTVSPEVDRMDMRCLLERVIPEIWVIPEGDSCEKGKAELSTSKGILLVTVPRTPPPGMEGISTTSLSKQLVTSRIPYHSVQSTVNL